MAGVSALLPRHVFGLRGDVKDNIHFVEENSLVFPVGHHAVLYNTETKVQRFIPGAADSEGITALAVSPNKKYLAVAERAEKGMITVYDLQTLKRRKVLVSTDAGGKDIVSMAFSPDGRLLAAQGAAPEWNLVIWVWEKSKVAASAKTTNQTNSPVYQVLFSPTTAGDGGVVSVIGNGIFKCFKLVENNMKLLQGALAKREPQNYTAHSWIMDGDHERIILGTDSGEILIIEGTDLKSVLHTDSNSSIESVLAHSKGFVGFVVGAEGGVLTLFDKESDERLYRKSKQFSVEGQPHKIRNMALSPTEESLLCTLDNNQMYSLSMSNTEIMKPEEMNFEIVAQPFHSSEVTGIDACIRKPLIATCSADRTVRLWNFMDKSMELVKAFSEEAYSVAVHPTGLSVLVGFADKLRLMTVLMDDFRIVKEFGIKACKECHFSHGGQYFAAVNGNTISIFNTYTCENVGNLRGHNGKVRSIGWSPDDAKLVSAGVDGAVYEWKLRDFKREKENVLKGCNYTCVVATPDNHTLYAVGSDKKLKELEDTSGTGTQITKEFDTGVVLTQIALPSGGRVLFGGTETGCLRAYKFPLTGEYQEYKCCSGAISRVRLSHDDSLLFVSGEDGSLFVFDVKDKDPTRATGKREQEKMSYAEEVLVTKTDLEEKQQRMAELETQVNELTMQNEYQLRLKDLNMNERIKEVTEKFTAELEVDKTKFELLLQEKNEQEMEYEEKLRQAEERHQAQLAALESQYQAKMMAEVERYQELSREKELLNDRWDEQNGLLVESHERVIQEVTEEYERRLQEEQLNLERLGNEKEEAEREFEEIKKQLEEDADREIEELKEKYEAKLAAERETGLRLKGENGIMKKKFNALQKDIEDQREEIKTLFEHKKELYQTISSLEKDIAGLKKEIAERDETIGDKEKRIYDLKKKNQELEKFKFVLDYKIKELKKQIEPRELQIADMRDQIKEMDHELERYHKNNATLDLTISDYKLKMSGLQKEIRRQQNTNNDAEQAIKRFQHDLQEAVVHLQEPAKLKEAMKTLFQKHVNGTVRSSNMEEDVQNEYNRQREYLEKTVDSLKKKLAKDTEQHRSENMRIMQENVALIKEINELRRDIKTLKHAAATSISAPGTMKRLPSIAGSPTANAGSRRASKEALSPQRSSATINAASENTQAEIRREVDMLRKHVEMLQEELANRDARIQQLEAQVAPRPMSRERPPLDHQQFDLPPARPMSRERGHSAERVQSPSARSADRVGSAGSTASSYDPRPASAERDGPAGRLGSAERRQAAAAAERLQSAERPGSASVRAQSADRLSSATGSVVEPDMLGESEVLQV
ncbi:hypothetical protein WJX72_010857 [[Myrmecia] bisecta]|uniref:WD repeat-containing protein 65 n=1 Tax=[Myrmecia] bisecta TaxID=41462 RepID=A0AAW1RAB1_9CHLO